MKQLLTKMFNGVAAYCNATEENPDINNYMLQFAEDMKESNLLILFSHWFNDIEHVAAHYGIGLAKKLPDGTLVYQDGIVDTMLLKGEVIVVDIPEAPSPFHWWYYGKWNEPANDKPTIN